MTFVLRSGAFKKLLLSLTTVALASCGGGGGGEPAGGAVNNTNNPTTVPVALPNVVVVQPLLDLRITEISAKASTSGAEGGWFEVHNPTAADILLQNYQLTSTAYAGVATVSTFSLPNVTIPAGGFIVLASKTAAFLVDGPQLKYIGDTTNFPSWSGSGFLELKLVAGAKTVDFVRFGTNTQTPYTAAEWTGTAAVALPTGTAAYGKSMVRLAAGNYADTNSAADWAQVNFSTPGGKNDVAPGVVDSDLDGVPDTAKVSGGTYAGLDLYAMGARPGQRDVFIEINEMDQANGSARDLGFVVRKEALQKVVDAFSPKGIKLHFDAGVRFNTAFSPADFNLGGSNAVGSIPFTKCTGLPLISLPAIPVGCSNFFEHKNKNLDVRRRVMFSYMLFANSQETTGAAGSSGLAEVNGNDAMITMGGFGFTTAAANGFTDVQNTQRYINMQASTVMHEFGHNLGLRHGGFEDQNNKPNYISVMNYMYTLLGIPGVQNNSTVGDRYIKYVSDLNYALDPTRTPIGSCTLSNSRCTNTFIIDYSDGSSPDLDEKALVGSNLMGRGIAAVGAFINWSGTAIATSVAYAFDVNRDSLKAILKDNNDWLNIKLPFSRNFSGYNTGASLDSRSPAADAARRDAINDAASKELVREDAPSAQFLRSLRD